MVLLTGCGKTENVPALIEQNDSAMVDYPVEVKELFTATYVEGYLREDMVKQFFKVSGDIEKVYVRIGDRVTKGQVLAKLDCRDMEEELELLKTIHQKQNELAKNQEKQFALQIEDEQSRMNELVCNGASNQEVMLKRIAIEEVRENAYYAKNSAKAEKQSREARIADLSQQIKEHYLYASQSGSITFCGMNLAKISVSAYEPFILISSNSCHIELKESVDINMVNHAKSMTAYVAGKPCKLICEKKIEMVAGKETQTGIFRIDEFQPEFLGTKVLVEIVHKSTKDALVIPEQALMKGVKGYYVYVKDNEQSVKCPVKIGMRQNGYVQITEGLKGNEVCYGYQTVTLSGRTQEEIVSRDELKEDCYGKPEQGIGK